ncbi:DsbA family protein [Wenyingzhuangia sp. IMCC45533]
MESSNYNCDINTGKCDVSPATDIKIESNLINNKKIKVTYYYDALCGWCYGFKDELSQFVNNNKDLIDFEVVNGGLFLNQRVGWINDVAPYVKSGAYKVVQETTKVQFGKDFLDKLLGDGKVRLNSLPPAIALSIIKQHKSEKAMEFAELLLFAVYHDGINVEVIEDYQTYVEKIGYDFKLFSKQMQETAYLELAQQDFKNFADHKISGMPTLVVTYKDKKAYLSNGFATHQDLEKRLKLILSE